MIKEQLKHTEYLELLYNLHSICEALIYDGIDGAEALLAQRLTFMRSLNNGKIPVFDGLILVTSLNRCIYDFFQFYMHISFTACCYNCSVVIMNAEKEAVDVTEAAFAVLKEYNEAFAQKRELCCYLEKARSYIRSHISENLTLERVGNAMHISGGYLSRIFSSLAGQTFCNYVRDERMAIARQLLQGTDLSIDEIAAQTGFSTPNYFASVFKRYMGITPSAYKAKSRKHEIKTAPINKTR